jgi:hypothetical protein
MNKIEKIIAYAWMVLIIIFAIITFCGCSSKIKPETQLTKQEIKDVVTDVLNQSSQNGLFNFQLNEGTMGGVVGLGVLAYAVGSIGKGSLRYVSHRRRLRAVDQWNTDPTGQSGRDS